MSAETTPIAGRSESQGRPADLAVNRQWLLKIPMILGRVLIALLFVLAGAAKIFSPQPFLAHMIQFGIPTFLLPVVIVLELGAGVALLVGWRVREAAAALGIFCVLTAAVFHHQFAISAERTSFFKDLAIAGGLFAIASTAALERERKRAL
jgi:putative oxidoreductase